MKWLSAAIIIGATLISGDALSEQIKPMPPSLQKAADCMYGILKKKPGFEKVERGLVEREGFVIPYLQYLSPLDAQGRRITVNFEAELPCATVNRSYNCCPQKEHACFMAVLGGLYSVLEPGPPDGDANVLIKEWNTGCSVYAWALFV